MAPRAPLGVVADRQLSAAFRAGPTHPHTMADKHIDPLLADRQIDPLHLPRRLNPQKLPLKSKTPQHRIRTGTPCRQGWQRARGKSGARRGE